MNRRIKTLLAWLLLLAVPLQGMAAAVEMRCGPSHHASVQAGAAVAHAHHATGAAVHHHQPLARTAGDAQPVAASADQIQHGGSCSACASCCFSAVAIASTSDIAPLAGPVGGFAVAPPPLFAGVIPPGLERPPRAFPS